jgi:hypothetical protein
VRRAVRKIVLLVDRFICVPLTVVKSGQILAREGLAGESTRDLSRKAGWRLCGNANEVSGSGPIEHRTG